MSLAQIEAKLDGLSADELRHLALRSRAVFLAKAGANPNSHECDEDDPALLAALDNALRRTDQTGSHGVSGSEVRTRIRQWITK